MSSTNSEMGTLTRVSFSVAPVATSVCGLITARATMPGKGSQIINAIRDGREAMAAAEILASAAEARQAASQRRGKRRKTVKVPYTPPE